MALKAFSQESLDRYQNDYYVHTDVVYRFGVVLTGSREGAERLTEETFRRLLEDLDKIKANVVPVDLLMALAWQSWNSIQGQTFHPWSQPTVISLLKLKTEERASLYIVDMVGFSLEKAAKLMGASEVDVRVALSAGRRRLVSGDITVL